MVPVKKVFGRVRTAPARGIPVDAVVPYRTQPFDHKRQSPVFRTRPTMHTRVSLALQTLLVSGTATSALGAQGGQLSPELIKGIEFRSIGPGFVTGRIADVEIDPKDPNVWYVATAFGGLWKTVNRGVSFEPIFDEGPSFTLCCVAVDPRNSNVVWLGTGENHSQRSAHFGDGVYKSTDAG